MVVTAAASILAAVALCPANEFFRPVGSPRTFQVMVRCGAGAAPWTGLRGSEMAIEDGLDWARVEVRLDADGRHVVADKEGLDQYLAKAKGRINLCLDCAAVKPEQLVEEIVKADMARQVVLAGRPEMLKGLRDAVGGKVAVVEEAVSDQQSAVSPDTGGASVPRVVSIAVERVTGELVKGFHERKVLVLADARGDADRAEYWRKAVRAGADWICTGVPEELLAELVWKDRPKRPVMMSLHRGANRYAPENTMPALAKAIRMGSDFVEFDVRTTSDGKYYLLHDSKVDRTTNGHGAMRGMTAQAVSELDAGAWFGRPFAGTRVPSLDEFLAGTKDKVSLYFDAKDITPIALAEAVERYVMADRTVVYQIPEYLAQVTAINPKIRGLMPLSLRIQLNLLGKFKPYAVDSSWEILSKDMIAQCHEMGIKVFSDAPDEATVDDYARAIQWQIDLIQTDHPLKLFRAVENLEAGRLPPATAPAK